MEPSTSVKSGYQLSSLPIQNKTNVKKSYPIIVRNIPAEIWNVTVEMISKLNQLEEKLELLKPKITRLPPGKKFKPLTHNDMEKVADSNKAIVEIVRDVCIIKANFDSGINSYKKELKQLKKIFANSVQNLIDTATNYIFQHREQLMYRLRNQSKTQSQTQV